jgi:Protein of unknown function (DUF4242)
MHCTGNIVLVNSKISVHLIIIQQRLVAPNEILTQFLLKFTAMPKYVIERDIPGAGKLTAEQLKGISQTSCGVLSNMGPQIQWVNSYVTADKIYCIYIAPNEDMVREHARQGGFPANSVSEVSTVIDPTTAE